MFHCSRRLRAFTTGCLLTALTLGPTSHLLANTADPDQIQSVTSTFQEAPATASEFDDVVTGISAGVDAGSLITPSPDPIREHTAFLSSMWEVLFDSEYLAGTSHLSTGEWISSPSGTLTATNENGNTLTVDIALSLEILPEQYSFIDQASIDTLANVSARVGIAWTTMTNASGVDSNILTWWYQWDSATGTQTAMGPLNTLNQSDIDIWNNVIPLMGDFFDDPLHYNIEIYDPTTFSFFSRFRSAVIGAVTTAASALTYHVVRTAIISASSTAAGAASATVVAGASLYAAIAAGVVLVVGVTLAAYMQLLADLEAAGIDTPGLSPSEVLRIARQLGLIELV